MEFWQHIYDHFDPVAFHLGPIGVHWYGIMYMLALISAFWVAKRIIQKDGLPISVKTIDDFSAWEVVGVIVGARLAFILFYETNTAWYLIHPWEIFNPFSGGAFVGIRGFSYHGGLIGFLAALIWFTRHKKIPFWPLLDLCAIAAPAGYTFGRIGNFLNQELFGRATNVPWGIYVNGVQRHPSQLYEAFTEGVLIFVILWFWRRRKHFDGELAMMYGVFYGIARFGCELLREPDTQLGYLAGGWLTMGQLLSFAIIATSLVGYAFLARVRPPCVRPQMLGTD
jgi:phosphatidylglycerol:prolipoprotein diacylglycerol transferase